MPMKTSLAFLVGLAGLVCFGCASKASISPMQKRQITTKQVDGAYETVYRATMTVLQDQGYVVKNTDMAAGLIVANLDRETSKGNQFWQAFWLGGIYNKGTFVEITMTIDRINETLQELRISLAETRYNQYGGKTDIKNIADPKIYDELANQIRVETKRREALGRGAPSEQANKAGNLEAEKSPAEKLRELDRKLASKEITDEEYKKQWESIVGKPAN